MDRFRFVTFGFDRVFQRCRKIQVGTLHGIVEDEGGIPLIGVTVSVADKTGQTSSTGRFLIENVPDGSHKLTVTEGGVEIHSVTVDVASRSREFTIRMGRDEPLQNLLVNAGYEANDPVEPQRPAHWFASDTHWPHVEWTKDAARTGEYGVKIAGAHFIHQRLPIEPGVKYELSAWARHDQTYEAGLKIELLGADGKHLPDMYTSSTRQTITDTEWTRFSTTIVPIDDAVTGILLVRSFGETEVYFDDVAFYRLGVDE